MPFIKHDLKKILKGREPDDLIPLAIEAIAWFCAAIALVCAILACAAFVAGCALVAAPVTEATSAPLVCEAHGVTYALDGAALAIRTPSALCTRKAPCAADACETGAACTVVVRCEQPGKEGPFCLAKGVCH